MKTPGCAGPPRGLEPRPFAADAPLVIAGPPGVGKTSVGRLAAARLGLELSDLDDLIAASAGVPADVLLRRDGEAAFRKRERALLEEALRAPRRRVIALGGGALVDPDLRSLVLGRAVVIALAAPAPVLAARLAASPGERPLLDGDGALVSRLEALLARRRDAYRDAHLVIDGARAAPIVASDVALAARDAWAWVSSRAGGYPVRVAEDGAAAVPDAVRGLDAQDLHLLADERVVPTWAGVVAAALAVAGRPVASAPTVGSGESHKRLATLERLAEELLAAGASRASALIAAGGGVTSDLGGLLAALYFRGIPWIAVPTTLLSMVDAAVGGKTAVDLVRTKNVLGAFHPPRAVVVDPAHARTEGRRGVAAGLAEAVKTALVGDPTLLELLEAEAEAAAAGDPGLLRAVVTRSLAVKVGVVGRDETEQGERAHLNLGHTFGHALESAAGHHDRTHGESVAIGLVAALRVGEALGVTEPGLAGRTAVLLDRLGLPTSAPPALCRAAAPLVAGDKKREGRRIRLVLVRRPGDPQVVLEDVERAAAMLAAAAEGG